MGSSSDSALCLPAVSSEDSVSETDSRESHSPSHVANVAKSAHAHEDVFTSESENSSVATCRTVRRIDPATGMEFYIDPFFNLNI